MSTSKGTALLPGEALVRRGLADAKAGRQTAPALLVQIARQRLARAGLVIADGGKASATPEINLYRMLRRDGGDAYSRYNALLRELVSFENALEGISKVAAGTRD